MINGYMLNAAIGLQVLLGALVTGLAAAVSPARVSLCAFHLLSLTSPDLIQGRLDNFHPRWSRHPRRVLSRAYARVQ